MFFFNPCQLEGKYALWQAKIITDPSFASLEIRATGVWQDKSDSTTLVHVDDFLLHLEIRQCSARNRIRVLSAGQGLEGRNDLNFGTLNLARVVIKAFYAEMHVFASRRKAQGLVGRTTGLPGVRAYRRKNTKSSIPLQKL